MPNKMQPAGKPTDRDWDVHVGHASPIPFIKAGYPTRRLNNGKVIVTVTAVSTHEAARLVRKHDPHVVVRAVTQRFKEVDP